MYYQYYYCLAKLLHHSLPQSPANLNKSWKTASQATTYIYREDPILYEESCSNFSCCQSVAVVRSYWSSCHSHISQGARQHSIQPPNILFIRGRKRNKNFLLTQSASRCSIFYIKLRNTPVLNPVTCKTINPS